MARESEIVQGLSPGFSGFIVMFGTHQNTVNDEMNMPVSNQMFDRMIEHHSLRYKSRFSMRDHLAPSNPESYARPSGPLLIQKAAIDFNAPLAHVGRAPVLLQGRWSGFLH